MARPTFTRKWFRKPFGILTCALVVMIGAIALFQLANTSNATMLNVNGHYFTLDIADTQASREQGLGGRRSLATDRGMLFVFSQTAQECFWMKGMHFPLDMIWIGPTKRVVYIERDISPTTFPETFCPSEPAKYVIELNAGTAYNTGIAVGQTLDF